METRPLPTLQPLPYHCELHSYFQSSEKALWDWFASAQSQADYTESLRLELLKATYRLDAEGHPELYKAAHEAREALELEIPLTIYQSQHSSQSNAALYYIPGEGHIVFCGPLLSLLTPAELKSVIGHELAHYRLWHRHEGVFHVADRMVQSIAYDPRAETSHVQSARWYQLYTEIFADRGSLIVTGDLNTVVSGLVKMQTGLAQVSATSYLKQAEEIFQKARVKTEELSHPEAFIRARALSLWCEKGEQADAEISAMIEGAAALDELDLLSQVRLTKTTRRLLENFLQPKWFQTAAVLGHAKMFFDDFKPAAARDAAFIEELKFSDARLKEYLCFVLLDFIAVDSELDEMPLAAALELGKQLGIETTLEKLITKELKVKAKELKRIKEQAPELLAKAEVSS